MSTELPSEYLAQTKLDEAVYTLLEAGWDASDILKKVDSLIEEYEEDNPPDE